ncbi:MAG TPA: hypothetical protein ENN09_02690 [Planctomycetes bacterium]|nr:hypothetical protein [Planctomycetota bacterium]
MDVGEKRRVRLGEYEIIERIGAGGMGQIFKATQVSLDRVVALKLLPKSMAKDRGLVERLYREAKAAARIIHPNVVQIYSVGEEHGVPYFAMEFVEGEDLEQKLSSGNHFTLEEAVDMVAAVAMALSAAAELGIVHRDIKPANIMINKSGVIKVTDFGLAKPTQTEAMNITQAGYIVGTPTYMSPEQAEGGDVDGRSDIYSLGIVFYELLTGLPPFVADSPAALIYKHVHETPRPPSQVNENIPPELDSVVLKCIAKKPEDRYQAAGDFLAELLEVRKTLGVEAGQTIVFDSSQAEKYARHRPTPVDTAVATRPREEVESRRPFAVLTTVLAAVVAGMLIIAGTIAYMYRDRDEKKQPVGQVQTEAQPHVRPTPAKTSAEVDFSFLSSVLPQGAACLLISSQGATPLLFSKITLSEGTYNIRIEKSGYLPLIHTLVVSKGAVAPPLKAEDFRLEPNPELAAAYNDFKQLYEQGNMAGALSAAEKVSTLDANFRDFQRIYAEVKQAVGAEAAAREGKWTHATEFFRKELYEDAVKLLKEIEADNPRFTEAQNIIKLAEGRLAELARYKAACEAAIRSGDVAAAEKELAALEKVAGARPVEGAFITHTKDLAAKLRQNFAAVDNEETGDDERRRLLLAILAAAPECKPAREKLDAVNKRIQARNTVEGLFSAAKGLFDRNSFEECRKTLARAKETYKDSGFLGAEILERIKQLDEAARLAFIRRQLDFVVLVWQQSMLSSSSQKSLFAEDSPLVEQTARYVSASMYPVAAVELALKNFTEAAGEEAIEGEVDFAATFSATPAGDVTIRSTLKTLFVPSEASYVIKAVTMGGEAVEEGQEAGAAGGLLRGTVSSINGPLVEVALDAPEEIPLGETLLFYGEGEVIVFPYSGKVAMRVPDVIAKGRMIRRFDGGLVVDVGAAPASLKKGAIAVYNPLRPAEKTPPRVLSLATSAKSAHTAAPLTITAEVANPDARPVAFRWQATGGKVQAELTPEPQVLWYPPVDKGVFTVTVKLLSGAAETSSVSVSVEGLGLTGELPKSYRAEGALAVGGAMFQDARDIAFDEANDAYILDGAARSVLVLSSGTRRSKGQITLPRAGDFRKIAAREGRIFLLDASRNEIVRYGVDANRAATPEMAIGGRGTGNGSLAGPSDFALLEDGRVLAVDQAGRSVNMFAADGRFLFSVGSPGKSTGNMDKPVAVAADSGGDYHVLDAGRAAILAFREAKLLGETALPERNVPATDLAWDAFMGRLVVLYENGDMYARRSGGWKKLASGGTELGAVASPSALFVDAVGLLHVADRRGRAIEIYDDGGFLGQLGGGILDRVDRFTVTSDGSMYLLDGKNAIIGKMSPQGALVGRFGGRGKDAIFEQPADLETGPDGSLYVLDTSRRQVLVFSPVGKLLKTIGQGGRLPARELMQPVDMCVRGDRVYVLQETQRHCVHVYSAEDASLLQVFPGTADPPLKTVQAVAVDETGLISVACARKPLSVYSAEGGLAAAGKTVLQFVAAGAASPDGTVAFLDSARNTLFVFRPGQEEKVIAVDMAALVKNPTDMASDAFGGLWVLGGGSLVRLVPVW